LYDNNLDAPGGSAKPIVHVSVHVSGRWSCFSSLSQLGAAHHDGKHRLVIRVQVTSLQFLGPPPTAGCSEVRQREVFPGGRPAPPIGVPRTACCGSSLASRSACRSHCRTRSLLTGRVESIGHGNKQPAAIPRPSSVRMSAARTVGEIGTVDSRPILSVSAA